MSDDQPQYKEILDNLSDGIYFVDRERRINYWNKGAERITGFNSSQIIGHRCMDNILNHINAQGVQICLDGCPLYATMKDGKDRQIEVFLHHADGHLVPVLVRTSPIRDKSGKITGAVETFSDNTALLSTRRRVSRLEKTILLDPVTGIGNRRFIKIRLQSALDEYHKHHIACGVLFIDIDDFKHVNDELGHDVGDRVLRIIATTLQRNLRTDDAIARWGGEEFVALLKGVHRKGLLNAAEKLRTLVENSRIKIGNREVGITISIGATSIRSNDNPASLLYRADKNMYRSKRAGRNRVSYDDPHR